VLSQPAYPGWQILVNDVQQDWVVVDDLMVAVDLPKGEHEVIFRFRPVSVYLGLGIAGVTLAVMLVLSRIGSSIREG
jgi:uncharacterized membrane protein YfhO